MDGRKDEQSYGRTEIQGYYITRYEPVFVFLFLGGGGCIFFFFVFFFFGGGGGGGVTIYESEFQDVFRFPKFKEKSFGNMWWMNTLFGVERAYGNKLT